MKIYKTPAQRQTDSVIGLRKTAAALNLLATQLETNARNFTEMHATQRVVAIRVENEAELLQGVIEDLQGD